MNGTGMGFNVNFLACHLLDLIYCRFSFDERKCVLVKELLRDSIPVFIVSIHSILHCKTYMVAKITKFI